MAMYILQNYLKIIKKHFFLGRSHIGTLGDKTSQWRLFKSHPGQCPTCHTLDMPLILLAYHASPQNTGVGFVLFMYVCLGSVLWCPLQFPSKNDVRSVFTPICFKQKLYADVLHEFNFRWCTCNTTALDRVPLKTLGRVPLKSWVEYHCRRPIDSNWRR
jgi:hypothetical protein